VCICTHVYTHTHTHTYTHIGGDDDGEPAHQPERASMRTRVWGRSVRRAFSLYVCVYIYVYVYILICLCIYVYHTHTHTHTRTHTYYRVYKGGPLDTLSREPKFKQDVKSRSKHSDEDVIYNMSSLMKQNLMRKTGRRTNTKHTLRRGRNMWYGWFN
jgi:hypothetical protein